MAYQADDSAALKHIFDVARIEKFAADTKVVWPGFDDAGFRAHAMNGLDDLGIMQRMRQIASAYDRTLPQDYETALAVLRDMAPSIQLGFAGIVLSEFVLMRGLDDFQRSMEALAFFTRFGTSEFAIRPFIERDPGAALSVMHGWTEDENEHVRRLASEGARPRLPWSFHLKALIADPELVLPILERMKADPSLYVRKSVANHLNDISKDHPDWLIGRMLDWDQSAPETGWIVKQALRTLVKKGDARALELIGASGKAEVLVDDFSVVPRNVSLGGKVTISARVKSSGSRMQKIVADYAVHYVKANGKSSRKVFKLKLIDLAPGESVDLSISQTIRDFSTRTHHAGWHKVELMLNGETVGETGFELTC